MVYTSLNMKEYVHGGGFKEDVPNLEEVIVQKGVAHFNNQETAKEINNHIYDFISKFWSQNELKLEHSCKVVGDKGCRWWKQLKLEPLLLGLSYLWDQWISDVECVSLTW